MEVLLRTIPDLKLNLSDPLRMTIWTVHGCRISRQGGPSRPPGTLSIPKVSGLIMIGCC